MQPKSWKDVLNAPAFLINLKRRPDRYEKAHKRISEGGFKNIQCITAVDATIVNLEEEWKNHGSPSFDNWDKKFITHIGKQGVMLSMLNVWKKIINEKIPYATIFEDDVLFHPDWHILAELYYDITPSDFDVVFYGNQLDGPAKEIIEKTPTYCLHAYGITYNGACKLYELFTKRKGGVYTIDCMFNHTMREIPCSYIYYVWNGMPYFPKEAYSENMYWRIRNTGLVFQDETLGTDIGI